MLAEEAIAQSTPLEVFWNIFLQQTVQNVTHTTIVAGNGETEAHEAAMHPGERTCMYTVTP